jgi:hypothetical protein
MRRKVVTGTVPAARNQPGPGLVPERPQSLRLSVSQDFIPERKYDFETSLSGLPSSSVASGVGNSLYANILGLDPRAIRSKLPGPEVLLGTDGGSNDSGADELETPATADDTGSTADSTAAALAPLLSVATAAMDSAVSESVVQTITTSANSVAAAEAADRRDFASNILRETLRSLRADAAKLAL